MGKIDHITNAEGTNLNRYTLKEQGQADRDVNLIHNPDEGFRGGTPFNEDTMNPIIDEVNLAERVVYKKESITLTGFPIELEDYRNWDKTKEYKYYLDYPVTGLVESSDKLKVGSIDNDCGVLAPIARVINNAIRFYVSTSDEVSVNLYDVLVLRNYAEETNLENLSKLKERKK